MDSTSGGLRQAQHRRKLSEVTPRRAVGVICRDANDILFGPSNLTIEGIMKPAVLESMACREALALAQDLHLQRITVATDCLAVVQDMSQPFAGIYSSVLQEIKETMALYEKVSFRHENQASNNEAHRLARSASASNVGRQVWLLEPLDGLCINNNVLS
jgi:HPt (histidine-containing phosphotransfer) domain-containing protein